MSRTLVSLEMRVIRIGFVATILGTVEFPYLAVCVFVCIESIFSFELEATASERAYVFDATRENVG